MKRSKLVAVLLAAAVGAGGTAAVLAPSAFAKHDGGSSWCC